MTVEFENLKEIPKLVALVEELIKLHKEGSIDKKWLNVEECAYYLGYSKDKVYKLAQEEWIEGVHYYKPSGRLIFDKEKIDEWVQGGSNISINDVVNDIFSNLVD